MQKKKTKTSLELWTRGSSGRQLTESERRSRQRRNLELRAQRIACNEAERDREQERALAERGLDASAEGPESADVFRQPQPANPHPAYCWNCEAELREGSIHDVNANQCSCQRCGELNELTDEQMAHLPQGPDGDSIGADDNEVLSGAGDSSFVGPVHAADQFVIVCPNADCGRAMRLREDAIPSPLRCAHCQTPYLIRRPYLRGTAAAWQRLSDRTFRARNPLYGSGLGGHER